MDMVNFINYDMGNVKIGDSIRTALNDCSYGDSHIARTINVSRDTIRRWKTGLSTTARQQNLSFLANELKLELKIEFGVAEFQELKLEEIEMAEGITQDIIKNQLDHIETLKKENKFLTKDNEKLKKTIAGLEDKAVNIPQLDHSKLQAVVNGDENKFHIISSSFSAMLGYSPIEILSLDFRAFLSKEMQQSITGLSQSREMKSAIRKALVNDKGHSFWNIKTKEQKNLYVRLMTHHISGSYYFCDAVVISKDEFKEGMFKILNSAKLFN